LNPISSLFSSFPRDTMLRSNVKPKPSTNARQFVPPAFTIKEIRDAIPAHCFERSALKSMMWVGHDLLVIGIVMAVATFIPAISWAPLRYLAWIVYWLFQGMIMVGPWILAHECGHGGFSSSTELNNAVGYILHSALFVPYQAWKISHAKHHKGTGSMERDVVFLPYLRSERNTDTTSWVHHFEDAPIVQLGALIGCIIIGFPMYLFMDMSGPTKSGWVSHFHAPNELFEREHAWKIAKSNLGIVLTISALAFWVQQTSFMTVMCLYGIPYLQVNAWITLITYLHHTHPSVPHYREAEWNFARGAICTIDRHGFGPIVNYFQHHISDTHVAHHLFSQMPFYHAQEATQHLKKFLGEYYYEDSTPIPMALWKSWRECIFVENEGDVVFYKSKNDY